MISNGNPRMAIEHCALTSVSQSMLAVTLLFELQNGQLKATSSFGFCFFGGGLDDFRFPISY